MADQEFQGKGTGVGGDGGAATAVAPSADTSTAGDDAQGQPIDLTSLPEFRSWQSKQDQKLSALQQRLAQAEAAKEREALAGMDQYERAQYEAEKNGRRAKELEDRLMQVQADQYRQQRLGEISKKYNVPIGSLDDSSPEAALASALDYLSGQGGKRPSNGTTGATAPRVDLGGGSPKGQAERLKERYREAKRGFDSGSMIRIAAEAEAAGVSLD